GEKGMLTEGGIRVPYIVSWTSNYPKGELMDMPVSTLDVMPTVLAAAGVALSGDEDGVDLTPLVKRQQTVDAERDLYWRFWNQSAIRHGKWKYLRISDQHEYLFRIDQDPEEKNNLIASFPEIAQELFLRLDAWGNELKPAGLSSDEMNVQEKNWYRHYLNVHN